MAEPVIRLAKSGRGGTIVPTGDAAQVSTPLVFPMPISRARRAPRLLALALALLAAGCKHPLPDPPVVPQGGIRQVGADSLNRFDTAVDAPSGAFQCRILQSPGGPGRTVVAFWPDSVGTRTLVNITVTRRPEAISYDEVRSPVPFRTPSVPTARAQLGRQGYRTTSISIDFVTGISFVRNLGGVAPDESIAVTMAQLWDNRAAGAPGRRAQEVLQRCLPRTKFPSY